MFSCRLLLSVHNVTVRKQTERFLNDFDTGEQTNKQAPQRLNDKRCYPCHAQRVEQSYIDVNGNPVCWTEFMDPVNDWHNGDCGCIVLCRIFAETATDGIDLAKHWLLFQGPQTSSSVTAVYRIRTPGYPQPSLIPNNSWQKKKLAWMQVWMSFILLLKSTAVYQSI